MSPELEEDEKRKAVSFDNMLAAFLLMDVPFTLFFSFLAASIQ